VLRRALLIWGWGHVTLGERRGWLLVLLQPLAIGGLALAAWQLIDGTRWLAVFVPLVALLVFWVGQAVHAHRRAVALGGAPGGELQLALFLPFAFAALTAFWLIGGRHGSPASTVEAYMDAWVANRPDVAQTLFAVPHPASDISEEWQSQLGLITFDISVARASYGVVSGLDPARPFNSLRVSQLDMPPGHTRFVVEVVRSERFETTLLGVIPTAGQRTVVVEQVLWIDLIEVDESDRAALALPSTAWRIQSIASSPA
jgi:hypothetical protein